MSKGKNEVKSAKYDNYKSSDMGGSSRDRKMKARMKRLQKKHPEKVYQIMQRDKYVNIVITNKDELRAKAIAENEIARKGTRYESFSEHI